MNSSSNVGLRVLLRPSPVAADLVHLFLLLLGALFELLDLLLSMSCISPSRVACQFSDCPLAQASMLSSCSPAAPSSPSDVPASVRTLKPRPFSGEAREAGVK